MNGMVDTRRDGGEALHLSLATRPVTRYQNQSCSHGGKLLRGNLPYTGRCTANHNGFSVHDFAASKTSLASAKEPRKITVNESNHEISLIFDLARIFQGFAAVKHL